MDPKAKGGSVEKNAGDNSSETSCMSSGGVPRRTSKESTPGASSSKEGRSKKLFTKGAIWSFFVKIVQFAENDLSTFTKYFRPLNLPKSF